METAKKTPKVRKEQAAAIRIPVGIPGPLLVRSYETDPGEGANPSSGPVILRGVPDPAATPLPIAMPTAPAPAGLYAPGTAEFRYWVAAEALDRGRTMWHGYAPSITGWNPKIGTSLPILLDAGDDLNAYYDRSALRFFHRTVAGRTVYSGESPDVVCHELGHAVLDAIQPRLWNTHVAETAAFHESFGDISALLSALQLPAMRGDLLAGTGAIYRNSPLSRLAEQLGWAIRQNSPTRVDADSLRNAVNDFLWQDPQAPGFPDDGPASTLSAEPHSFSRVFTSAFLLALSNVFALQTFRNEAMLVAVVNEMGGLLVQAIRAAAVVPHYYASVASAMVAHAPAPHRTAIRLAFQRKNILRPILIGSASGGISIPGIANPHAEVPTDMVAATPAEPVLLGLDEFGFAGRLLVDAGDNPATDGVGLTALGIDTRAVSAQDAARRFVTGLFVRDRVMGPDEDPDEARSASGSLKSHRIVAEEGGDGDTYRLERVRIDCGTRGS